MAFHLIVISVYTFSIIISLNHQRERESLSLSPLFIACEKRRFLQFCFSPSSFFSFLSFF